MQRVLQLSSKRTIIVFALLLGFFTLLAHGGKAKALDLSLNVKLSGSDTNTFSGTNGRVVRLESNSSTVPIPNSDTFNSIHDAYESCY